MTDPGITITLREIYDSVQEVAAGVRRLDEKVNRLEEKVKEATGADERSREAYALAEEVNGRLKELERFKQWIEKTIIGALVTGGIGLLFYLAQH